MVRFFTNDTAIKGMLDVFASEVSYRAELQGEFISRDNYGSSDDANDYLWVITNAVKILNIVKPGKVFNPPRTKERVALIKKFWGEIPEAPQGLRNIRNKAEHFADYIEDWFSTTDGEYAHQLDTLTFLYRYDTLDGGTMYYLEDSVAIKDVIEWVEQMGEVVKDWNYTL